MKTHFILLQFRIFVIQKTFKLFLSKKLFTPKNGHFKQSHVKGRYFKINQ